MSLSTVHLNLHPKQIHRLQRHHTIQITHPQIGSGHEVVMHTRKARKIARAHREQRGVRLQLSPEEMEMQGGAFLDKLRELGRKIKQGISSDFYQKNIRPVAKQALGKLVDVGTQYIPALAPYNAQLHQGVEKLGEVTGAAGLRHRRVHHRRQGGLRGGYVPPKGTALNVLYADLPDSSRPNPQLIPGHATGTYPNSMVSGSPKRLAPVHRARQGRFVKGSKEAYEWSARMRESKARKHMSGSSFKAVGGSFRTVGQN